MTDRKQDREQGACLCPYCETAAKASLPICQACGAEITRCSQCGKVLSQGQAVCPACGSKVLKASPARRRSA